MELNVVTIHESCSPYGRDYKHVFSIQTSSLQFAVRAEPPTLYQICFFLTGLMHLQLKKRKLLL